jgi:hypothetical protein
MVIDFVAEHLGLVRYSGRRQMVTTAVAAPALGYAFGRYLTDNSEPSFWLMVGVYTAVCFAAFLFSQARARRIEQNAEAAAFESNPLVRGFESREAFLAYLAENGEDRKK